MKKILLIIGAILIGLGIAIRYFLPHLGYFGLIRVAGLAAVLLGLTLCSVGGAFYVKKYSKSYIVLLVIAALILVAAGLKTKDVVLDCIEGPKLMFITEGKLVQVIELPDVEVSYYLEFTRDGQFFSLPMGKNVDTPNASGSYDFQLTFFPRTQTVLRCVICAEDMMLTEEEYNALTNNP